MLASGIICSVDLGVSVEAGMFLDNMVKTKILPPPIIEHRNSSPQPVAIVTHLYCVKSNERMERSSDGMEL
jgi:hypothetical protein